MKRILLLVGAIAAACSLVSEVRAEPALQLYVEGATYDEVTESWVYSDPTSSGPFRLWAIGNTGQYGTIEDVKISAVYSTADGGPDVQISLTPTTAGGVGSYQGISDPSTPTSPTDNGKYVITDSTSPTPKLSDGSDLPSHGEYSVGKTWHEFLLGDFTLTDSHLGDFITSFPTSLKENHAQINVYEVAVSGSATEPLYVHFDLYNHVQAGTQIKAKFAPFSHDAIVSATGDGGALNPVPEPSSIALLGMGAFGVLSYVWGRRKRRAAVPGSV